MSGQHTPGLLAAIKAYFAALDAFNAWLDENPGASGSRFSAEADNVSRAKGAVLAAIARAEGRS